MIDELLKFFVLFFVVVEPVTLVPVFATLTHGASEAYRRRMSLKAVAVSGLALALFPLGGAWFIRLMGISADALRLGRWRVAVTARQLDQRGARLARIRGDEGNAHLMPPGR